MEVVDPKKLSLVTRVEQLFEHDRRLREHGQQLYGQSREIADHSRQLDGLAAWANVAQRELVELKAFLAAAVIRLPDDPLTFWGRLRWLVIGR